MAKFNIRAKTFNDIQINPEVEVHIVVGNRKDDFLSLNAYTTLKSKIENDLKIDDFKFYLISKDIKELLDNDVVIDDEDLINKIYPELLNESDNLQIEMQNKTLKRAIELFENRDFSDAKELLESIEKSTLSKFDYDDYMLLKFKLLDDKEKGFKEYKEFFKNNPIKLKELYFDYIKYLEDKREEKKPYELLKEFEDKFTISEFSSEEKALYLYLKGRNYYFRGEFLLALENLSQALKLAKDERLIANIYNSATNSFTDNLFFEEALNLAKKALDIREKLKLPEVADTLSLIGGIYLKSNHPKKALDYFKTSLNLQKNRTDRIYNYLAKTSILLGFFNKAKEYIKEAKKFEDSKGFTFLVKLLLLSETKSYKDIFEEAKKNIFIPEIRAKFDKVVLGWAYYILAKKAFEEELYFDGIKYLDNSISYFLKDKYILEGYYVSILNVKLPKKEQEYFEDILIKHNLKELFLEYLKKHSQIANRYCELFGIKNSNKNNLENFLKNPQTDNYFLI